jgi:hypothetical protein
MSLEEVCANLATLASPKAVTSEVAHRRVKALGVLLHYLPESLHDEAAFSWILTTYAVDESERRGITLDELDQIVDAKAIAAQALAQVRARYPGSTFDADGYTYGTESLCGKDLNGDGKVGKPGA